MGNSDNAANGSDAKRRKTEDHAFAQENISPGKEQKDEDNSWKNRVPYRSRTPEDKFEAKWHGECHCGQVKYQLSRKEPLMAKFCHCGTCQKLHGAPFQWAAIFHKEDVNFLNGAEGMEWYDTAHKSEAHSLPGKVKCSHCHSPIMDEGRNMILMFPPLIHFNNQKEKELFTPKCHIFYSKRAVDVPDGLPKWSGLDQQSELIEDTPEKAIKEWEASDEKKKLDKQES